jgi:hypothetical protein
MSEGSGFGRTPGDTDEAAGTVYTSSGQSSQSLREDGQAVGAADVEADRVNSGADSARDGDAGDNTYDPLEDDVPVTEDGQSVGAADRDADVDRTS